VLWLFSAAIGIGPLDLVRTEKELPMTQTTQQPEIAPHGYYFYLATTPSPTDKGRRYLHSIHRPEKPFGEARVKPNAGASESLRSTHLARAYPDLVNRVGGVAELCIVLEAGRVLDHPTVPKIARAGQERGV
jgi:hypothetical protein